MKYLTPTIPLLLLWLSAAYASNESASCELAAKSVVSRSSSGLAQVSNLGNIEITCSVTVPQVILLPGEIHYPPKAVAVAYQILTDGSKKKVSSEINQSGVGYDAPVERVFFHLLIPLEPAERDAEASRLLAKIEETLPSEQITEESHQRALERMSKFISQNRAGHFQLRCRILEGDRVIGIGVVEFEVLFKGRVSDVGLPAAPPA